MKKVIEGKLIFSTDWYSNYYIEGAVVDGKPMGNISISDGQALFKYTGKQVRITIEEIKDD